jgi:hypothetical protein
MRTQRWKVGHCCNDHHCKYHQCDALCLSHNALAMDHAIECTSDTNFPCMASMAVH